MDAAFGRGAEAAREHRSRSTKVHILTYVTYVYYVRQGGRSSA
jgi:hypothetical protein